MPSGGISNVYGNAYQFADEPGGGGGVGSTQITFVCRRGGTGVEGVRLELLATDRVFWTGTDGTVFQNLNPGDYTLRTTPPPGYQSVADQPLTVGDADDIVIIPLVLIEPGPLPDPGGELIQVRCRVYLNGVPISGASVRAELQDNTSAVTADTIVASTLKNEAETVDGYAELTLYRAKAFSRGNGVYNITASHEGKTIWSHSAALPDAQYIDLPAALTQSET